MRIYRKANPVISLILAVVLAFGVLPATASAASSKEIQKQIDQKHRTSRFKFQTIPVYHNGLPIVIEDGTDFYK